MNHEKLIPIILILLLSVGLYYFIFNKKASSQFFGTHTTLRLGQAEIKAELAITEAQRAKGLMFRETLGENEGMLFVFPKEAVHSFWMANTKIPLDIIWINSDFEIVYISENTPPCQETGQLKSLCTVYKPDKKAKYVLEVNAGYVKNHNIQIKQSVLLL